MFGRLRLIGRGAHAAGSRKATGAPARSEHAHAVSGEQAVPPGPMSPEKALRAYALANPPQWTNALSQYDPWGRSENVAGSMALPRVTPLGTNVGPRAHAAGEPDTTKGGLPWDSSAAPR
jgi:hypothetical protein